MKRDVIYLAIIGVILYFGWILNEAHLAKQAALEKEKQSALDMLSECNGLVKLNGFKWPADK